MKAGMILRSKSNLHAQRWFIKKEGTLERKHGRSVTLIKGYRLAPSENLELGFWVTEEQIHHRFEEDV